MHHLTSQHIGREVKLWLIEFSEVCTFQCNFLSHFGMYLKITLPTLIASSLWYRVTYILRRDMKDKYKIFDLISFTSSISYILAYILYKYVQHTKILSKIYLNAFYAKRETNSLFQLFLYCLRGPFTLNTCNMHGISISCKQLSTLLL